MPAERPSLTDKPSRPKNMCGFGVLYPAHPACPPSFLAGACRRVKFKLTSEFWRLRCGKLPQPPKFKAAYMFFDLVRLIGHPSSLPARRERHCPLSRYGTRDLLSFNDSFNARFKVLRQSGRCWCEIDTLKQASRSMSSRFRHFYGNCKSGMHRYFCWTKNGIAPLE